MATALSLHNCIVKILCKQQNSEIQTRIGPQTIAAARAFKKFLETDKESDSSTVQICKIIKELGDLDLNGKLRNSAPFFEYLTDSARGKFQKSNKININIFGYF